MATEPLMLMGKKSFKSRKRWRTEISRSSGHSKQGVGEATARRLELMKRQAASYSGAATADATNSTATRHIPTAAQTALNTSPRPVFSIITASFLARSIGSRLHFSGRLLGLPSLATPFVVIRDPLFLLELLHGLFFLKPHLGHERLGLLNCRVLAVRLLLVMIHAAAATATGR